MSFNSIAEMTFMVAAVWVLVMGMDGRQSGDVNLPVQAQEAEARKRKRPKAPVGLGQLTAKKKKGTKGLSSMIDKWQAVRKEEVCLFSFHLPITSFMPSAYCCSLSCKPG